MAIFFIAFENIQISVSSINAKMLQNQGFSIVAIARKQLMTHVTSVINDKRLVQEFNDVRLFISVFSSLNSEV